MKLFILIILTCSVCVSVKGEVEEVIFPSVDPSEYFPYDYVISASTAANKRYKDPVKQKLFVSSYADALWDISVFGLSKREYIHAVKSCMDEKEHESLRRSGCAYSDVFKDIEQNGKVDLRKLGFSRNRLTGKVRMDKRTGRYLHKLVDGTFWEVVFPASADHSASNLEGYLSPKSDYSSREDDYDVHHVFVVDGIDR